jgi:exodeoxyribonuclease VII small subunit
LTRSADLGSVPLSSEDFQMAKAKSTTAASSDSSNTPSTALPFEKTLAELEQLVKRMESGDLSLEDSLSAFEKGIKLTRECQQSLLAAEQKVQILLEENGRLTRSDFHDADE